jgi:hypothetical protein
MDTKNSVSNVKEVSSTDKVVNTPDTPNSNIKESRGAGSDIKTIDMSGTNIEGATNERTDRKPQEESTSTVDASVPNPSYVKGADNAEAIDKKVSTENAKDNSSLVKVRLTAPHTHEGIGYEDGDIIEVDESSANYIVDTANSGVRV